jgi:hypothetical protein
MALDQLVERCQRPVAIERPVPVRYDQEEIASRDPRPFQQCRHRVGNVLDDM